ncbi:MAG: amino acid permease [Methanoregulaceae archaeon]|jgi:amino acid transporter
MTETPSYKRGLGLFELVSLGVGGTIGSGIFVVPGIAARIAGPASLIAWVIVAISASSVLVSLAYVSKHFTQNGSFLSMFESVFGIKLALPIVLLYLISSIFGVATIASGIGQYMTYFNISHVIIIEIAILTCFCLINIIGISLSGTTENILTLIKIIPLVVIAIILLPFVNFTNLVPNTPISAGALFATVIIVYWPFTGFEISAIPIEETKDIRIISRALLIVMAIVVTVYLVLNISLIGSVGYKVLAQSPAPIATASGLIYKNSGPFIAVIGIVAMLSALNAYIIGTSRILQNISMRCSVPLFRDLSNRGTPVAALISGSFLSGILLLYSNHFDLLATISVITTLIPYVFFCVTAWVLNPLQKYRIVSAVGILSTTTILLMYFIV